MQFDPTRWSCFRKLAARPVICVMLLGAAAFGSAALAATLSGIPVPFVHDEFSYLLAGETFSKFRLTNPTHPLWMFFESMHIVHEPSYASMYPPGQGMALAIGYWLGHPIVGVWLSVAAMASAVYWMLLGWVPRRWALLGGAMAVLKWTILGRAAPMAVAGYFSQTYYGGAVQAIGGALLFGGLARIVGVRAACAKPSAVNAVIMAFGVALLANTRPFEGMMLSLPAAVILLAWLVRRPVAERMQAIKRVVVPAGVVIVLMVAFIATYNQQVTGKVSKLPWQHHHEQYCTFPVFLWQQPSEPPGWNHAELEHMHGTWELDLWRKHRSAEGMIRLTGRKSSILWAFYVAPLPRLGPVSEQPPDWAKENVAKYFFDWFKGISVAELILGFVLTVPLFMLVRLLRLKWTLFAIGCCGVVVAGNLVTSLTAPHYAAPAAAMFMLVIVQALRATRISFGNGGRRLFAIVMVITVCSFAYGFVPMAREGAVNWYHQRTRIIEQLESTDGQHLVIVKYGPHHDVHKEWVFNGSDIDTSKIVWARDMGQEKNQALLDYFKDRKVWLLDIEDDDAKHVLKPVE